MPAARANCMLISMATEAFPSLCILDAPGFFGRMLLVSRADMRSLSRKRPLASFRIDSRHALQRFLRHALADSGCTSQLLRLLGDLEGGCLVTCPTPYETEQRLLAAFDTRRLFAIHIPELAETGLGDFKVSRIPSLQLDSGPQWRAALPRVSMPPRYVDEMSVLEKVSAAFSLGIEKAAAQLTAEDGIKLAAALGATILVAGATILLAKYIVILFVVAALSGWGLAFILFVVGLIGWTIVALKGAEILVLSSRLYTFITVAAFAETKADLDEAAEALASALVDKFGDELIPFAGTLTKYLPKRKLTEQIEKSSNEIGAMAAKLGEAGKNIYEAKGNAAEVKRQMGLSPAQPTPSPKPIP